MRYPGYPPCAGSGLPKKRRTGMQMITQDNEMGVSFGHAGYNKTAFPRHDIEEKDTPKGHLRFPGLVEEKRVERVLLVLPRPPSSRYVDVATSQVDGKVYRMKVSPFQPTSGREAASPDVTPVSPTLDSISTGSVDGGKPEVNRVMANEEPKAGDINPGRLPADSKAYRRKRAEIVKASRKRDVGLLAKLATSEGGLLEDDIRKQVWPILQGYVRATHTLELPPLSELPCHGDEDQVKLDVDRSFVYYPNYKTEKHLKDKRDELLDLIVSVLRRNPMLCYFQGYHDIAQVLLLVLDRKHAYQALEHISLFRIRDYMLPSLSPALTHLQLLPAIITSVDQKLGQHLSGTKPFFALAATLTLYAHDIEEYTHIARLYDFILAHEPVVSIYLFATIILSRKDELYDIPQDEPEMFHGVLSKLPRPLDLETLISNTVRIYQDHPPEKLPCGAWKSIPSYSVLKTLRNPGLQSTSDQARGYFHQQIRGLQRAKMRKDAVLLIRKHSFSIKLVGATVAVGILSYWMMKRDPDLVKHLWRYLEPLKTTLGL
ncbi:hypothetical protein A7C99_3964 [Trichophyton rubrum]|uniref:Rab-GAP TBC domain-containing protein n=4 Tax=Trichophyton TaxID=5550 RepID=A0A178EWP8_TRIRU|nr:hypothetical protein A7C99_3964 [Trichophyton rubrum]